MNTFVKALMDCRRVDPMLSETIAKGFHQCFSEGASSWGANYFPTSTASSVATANIQTPKKPFGNPVEPINRPLGDAKSIYPMVSAPTGALGQSNDAGTNYHYGPALAGPTRDQSEETRKEKWGYKFPTYAPRQNKALTPMLKGANAHIPEWGQYMNAPINYFADYILYNFGGDVHSMGGALPIVGGK